MDDFLKIDVCQSCKRPYPWEWTPAVLVGGKALPGTGTWRSQLLEGICPPCTSEIERRRQKHFGELMRRQNLLELLGGEKPCRDFTFDQFKVTGGNKLAFERAKSFDPDSDNLYLWGPCGVGKTHLAWATARRSFEETLSVAIVPAYQLSRRIRMRDPAQEQAAIDEFVRSEVLVLDDLGTESGSPFNRQILQEILDRRTFANLGGLVVTSKYSLDELAAKFTDDAIPSRLAGYLPSSRSQRDRSTRRSTMTRFKWPRRFSVGFSGKIDRRPAAGSITPRIAQQFAACRLCRFCVNDFDDTPSHSRFTIDRFEIPIIISQCDSGRLGPKPGDASQYHKLFHRAFFRRAINDHHDRIVLSFADVARFELFERPPFRFQKDFRVTQPNTVFAVGTPLDDGGGVDAVY
jgi:DNA replication protein DnaC